MTKYAVQRELEPGERMREGRRDRESGREGRRDEREGEQEREGSLDCLPWWEERG